MILCMFNLRLLSKFKFPLCSAWHIGVTIVDDIAIVKMAGWPYIILVL